MLQTSQTIIQQAPVMTLFELVGINEVILSFYLAFMGSLRVFRAFWNRALEIIAGLIIFCNSVLLSSLVDIRQSTSYKQFDFLGGGRTGRSWRCMFSFSRISFFLLQLLQRIFTKHSNTVSMRNKYDHILLTNKSLFYELNISF